LRAQNRTIFPQNFIRSFGRLFVGFVEAIKKAPFFISRHQKGRLCLIHHPAGAFQDAPAYFFAYEEEFTMNDQNETAQLRFLEETATRLRQNGFTVEPIEDHHLPVCWEKGRLCRVSSKGSVLYRQERAAPGAQDALQTVIDIAKTTSEYMPMMERTPQLKARNLEAIPIFFLKCDLQFPPGTSLCIMQPLKRMPQV
jgi:hypothetical protein